MANESKKVCLFCEKDPHQTPLIGLEYRDTTLWICPQHLPILIHDPAKLVGKLPGAEDLSPADS